MTDQPGYDALADLYDQTFPDGYSSDEERAAVDRFDTALADSGASGPVVDVGCGTGHQAHELSTKGFDVIGVDPSAEMLAHARRRFPDLALVQDDARLGSLGTWQLSGILARYSLIHVPPEQLADVLAAWAMRLRPGGVVMTAFQAIETDAAHDVEEFDHVVAPAWRWRPDAMSAMLATVGLAERWRMVTPPADGFRRFPECHLMHVRTSRRGAAPAR
ncbi:class I SAM-dependent DNA methyltransferase [Aeromicrobium fastidiosum]|uniref:Class I SAM-dependent methyltransferase n=1 Tax=Aeromicrobium fastidiosum TaxID=52699 RepID=A0A641AKY3_9ACTN|nr:class I SAM-dependent methyltransferase [Aeromicrobium fastidiosum]KAA1376340.1 class I SAM-dependent methyltransferase [Aeromicrobium fastidiosum]MBP2391760.1 SAM-dependent methyltransferase [Aeromicrobium fastidiosum]